ncbi:DUF4013 domain-containing protein [Prosthecobacter sp.]|uniref:DUF4013 domain-containing protein n=1 Tax=Prosthecobacter sp. TaxID=1965333 RepID=UPI0024872CA4|nr:DUF4013 domain-containing protein [Prosthecobacter sp.]MDI1311940.1 hypothetical protein [Prosthecobacter sp.]
MPEPTTLPPPLPPSLPVVVEAALASRGRPASGADAIRPELLTVELPNTVQLVPHDSPSGVAPLTERLGFFRRIASGLDWLFGLAALLVLLAACSVVPVLNFLSLGYLLHVSGTIARRGRFRAAFIGVRKAAVLGSIAAGVWIVVWPARLLSRMWKDAELISPGSGVAKGWHAGLIVVIVLTITHIVWACVRGGKLRHFLWPQPLRFWRWLRAPQKFGHLQGMITDYVIGLRLPFYFWLGLRGFVGALLWLIVPVGILLAATRLPVGGSVALSLLGGFLLLFVAMHLPFLQAHFAQTDRFSALFELREVRRLFLRAPLAFWFALLITLLFAVPLYLLKIELTPRELAWLPSLLFVIFIFPARVLTGWAMSRAKRREEPRHWFPRWVARVGILPVALAYTLVVYFTPYLSWNGAWSLLEQHAFLVPAPLMAL